MWGVSSNTKLVGFLSFISPMSGQVGENGRRSRRQGQGIRTSGAPTMSEADFQASVERFDVLMWLRDHQAIVPVPSVERRV